MTKFLRLLGTKDKAAALMASCKGFRTGQPVAQYFDVEPRALQAIPGTPFSYWVSDTIRETFQRFPAFEGSGRTAKVGLATADDFRFLRAWWEIGCSPGAANDFHPFAKGGSYSPYYSDLSLVLNWKNSGAELKQTVIAQHGNAGKRVYNEDFYFRPAITWPLRAHKFSPQALPAGCNYLFKSALGRFGYPEFIVGILQLMPWPAANSAQISRLAELTRAMWSKKRSLDLSEEVSHAFTLPAMLCTRLGDYRTPAIEGEMARIQAEIDTIAFDLYGLSDEDRATVSQRRYVDGDGDGQLAPDSESDDESSTASFDEIDGLLSWAVGVAFGRFDWRLATGERTAPSEPQPFDPLPAKSPGMLPEGAAAFHAHPGILVDDAGHPHDLVRVMEVVLGRVEAEVPGDLRRWVQRDMFPSHLQRYSRGRRKAPIYWPLATTSGSYTLWVYYPSLSSQTLYSAINDFVEPKLKQVHEDIATLRNRGTARTRDDERQFEALQSLEAELFELLDKLREIAAGYKPRQDDGVQITAAPLWPLFRHKSWQKVLKDTWAKLEKGDYDWAHLAMTYWPDRVREKCKTDKSLAIAHGLEDLYVEPEAAPKKTRGRKKADT